MTIEEASQHEAIVEQLEFENDTLRAFIIDIYNAHPSDQLNIIFDARNYITQQSKKL